MEIVLTPKSKEFSSKRFCQQPEVDRFSASKAIMRAFTAFELEKCVFCHGEKCSSLRCAKRLEVMHKLSGMAFPPEQTSEYVINGLCHKNSFLCGKWLFDINDSMITNFV